MKKQQQIDIKMNGRLFPTWILANFKNYKLDKIITEGDTCNNIVEKKKQLRKYQLFISKFMDYNSIYKTILLYHGVGSGKTATTINIYNMLYKYTPGWNVYILLKASLKESTWIAGLELWLDENEKQFRKDNIKFISYDAPNADTQFINTLQKSDATKKSIYIIDEAHNFIKNVYSNITTQKGKRGQKIYDEIMKDLKYNPDTRLILLSGTPIINEPFELALLFNMLRPNIFPTSEKEFQSIFVSQNMLNHVTKNMFQRRIMGLVSYYIGATPDLYATQKIYFIESIMSKYQEDIYNYFEKIEDNMRKKSNFSSAEKYKTYTRQACNFVFPYIKQGMSGETRPRPTDMKFNKQLDEGKITTDTENVDKLAYKNYMNKVDEYINEFDNYLFNIQKEDEKNGYTLKNDIEKYKTKYEYNYEEFIKDDKKSNLFIELHKCSCKIINMIFYIFRSKGPVLVYSNFVLLEGLQIIKIYLKYFDYIQLKHTDNTKEKRYTEFHGSIDKSIRDKNLAKFNEISNKYGEICQIILISPAGSEGLNLYNVRQVHLFEPYWHETRMIQMIGRAVRQCSHKYLPLNERHVDVYRYKAIKMNKENETYKKIITTDQYIENASKEKHKLTTSFLDAIKEVAIDCELFKNHNMITENYKCFKFEDDILFDNQIGPAYKENLFDDELYNNGYNDINSVVEKIKIIKVNAVILLKDDKYSDSNVYYLNPETNIIYDKDLFYIIGKILVDTNGIPKFHNDNYIISQMVPIGIISN